MRRYCASCEGDLDMETAQEINDDEYMCEECFDTGNFPSRLQYFKDKAYED